MTFKYCPDCGAECRQKDFKTFQCTSCQHNFWDEPVTGSAGLIRNAEGKYLFIRRNIEPGKGSIAVPGGCVDNGESLEECCIRECFEETGVQITNLKYFGSYPNKEIRGEQTETSISAFFTAETNDMGKSDKNEVSEIFWLKKDEIDISKITLSDIKAFITDFLRSG